MQHQSVCTLKNPNETSLGDVSIATTRGAAFRFWRGGAVHAVREGVGIEGDQVSPSRGHPDSSPNPLNPKLCAAGIHMLIYLHL